MNDDDDVTVTRTHLLIATPMSKRAALERSLRIWNQSAPPGDVRITYSEVGSEFAEVAGEIVSDCDSDTSVVGGAA